jgi:Rhodopirellula transposase DDE domain
MKNKNSQINILREKFAAIKPLLNERSIRIWCATEAKAIGRGGKAMIHKATGVSWPTITKGLNELKMPQENLAMFSRIRKKGGGRKKITDKDKTLLNDLDQLIDPNTRGDPETSLRWSSKSTLKLADELRKTGHKITQRSVHRLLTLQKYSMKSNRKTYEGAKNNPDRDAQFKFINKKAMDFQSKNAPVLSVDTKKKENIGNFKNNGKEWSRKGEHIDVNVYDFIDKNLGKAAPYGVYDISKNKGWVSVGISSDTAEFAVNSIRNWWLEMGKETYEDCQEIMITADCGGNNGNRVRLWEFELQQFANEIGKSITVCHYIITFYSNNINKDLICLILKVLD